VTGSEKVEMLDRLRKADVSIPAGRVRQDELRSLQGWNAPQRPEGQDLVSCVEVLQGRAVLQENQNPRLVRAWAYSGKLLLRRGFFQTSQTAITRCDRWSNKLN
jgi:hypothetical protein